MEDEPTTGTSAIRVFDTLEGALRVHQLPVENYAMMHRITEHIPMVRFEIRSDSIRGIRRDGGHEIKFVSGYVTGFQSEEEGETAADTTCWENSKTGVNWMVWLPLNSGRDGTGQRKDREQPKCPECGNYMPANGICEWDH